MPWWAWLLLALYAVGYALAFRRIAGQLAWHFLANAYLYQKPEFPTGEHWFGAITVGVLFASVWPISLPIALGIASARTTPRGLFYTPPDVRERLYKERIEALEREAGIR